MAKTKRKKTATKEPARATLPSPAEQLAVARREARQLRDLKTLMNQIRRKRLDNEADGVQLARVLVAGTEYAVVSELWMKQLEHNECEAKAAAALLAVELDEAKRQLNPDAV